MDTMPSPNMTLNSKFALFSVVAFLSLHFQCHTQSHKCGETINSIVFLNHHQPPSAHLICLSTIFVDTEGNGVVRLRSLFVCLI